MIPQAQFAAILQAANAAVDKRMAEREAIRPLMPLYPGFSWAQIHRGLTVPAVDQATSSGGARQPGSPGRGPH
jgi:hypothetical protein